MGIWPYKTALELRKTILKEGESGWPVCGIPRTLHDLYGCEAFWMILAHEVCFMKTVEPGGLYRQGDFRLYYAWMPRKCTRPDCSPSTIVPLGVTATDRISLSSVKIPSISNSTLDRWFNHRK